MEPEVVASRSFLIPVYLLGILLFTISAASATARSSHPPCRRTCASTESQPRVPYPFGFSSGCPIHLNCSSDPQIRIGRFSVESVTANGIVLRFPARCNVSIDSISPLFSDNFALSWDNTLLLYNCSHMPNGCMISGKLLASQLGLHLCRASDSFSCYPSSRLRRHVDVMSFHGAASTTCNSLFTSFASGLGDQNGSFVFQKLLLSWWLDGECPNSACSKDATCKTVRISDSRTGYRCECNDGFIGDGFAAGDGCRRESRRMGSRSRKLRVGEILEGVVAGALLMAILAMLCFYCRRRSNYLRNKESARRLVREVTGNFTVPMYQYKEIEKATDGFSDNLMLGTGAYGTVYAGKLHSGELVAVKRIRRKDDCMDQFMNEIKLLSSVNHPNLVRLLGCCIEDDEHILVYEFMPNGTLCQHLQKERGGVLPWTVRLTIAAETANAIAYLHSAVNPPIYHRDIKSSNILLDEQYRSKVADFGLSRLGITEEMSHISTAPQGTPGYLDPQYQQYFHLSDKSDVYSFGVVLVEIITGLKVVDFSRSVTEVNLAALAIDRIGRGCVDEILDACMEPTQDAWTMSSIHRVAELAFRCLAGHRDMRPMMTEVADELNQICMSAYGSSICAASSFGSGSLTSMRVRRENLTPLE